MTLRQRFLRASVAVLLGCTAFSSASAQDTTRANRDTTRANRDTTAATRDTAGLNRDTTRLNRDTTAAIRDTSSLSRDTTGLNRDTTGLSRDSIQGNPVQLLPPPEPAFESERIIPILVPSERAPFRQRFDLSAPDAQYLLLVPGRQRWNEGPYSFRFENPELASILEPPNAVTYFSVRDTAFLLQVLNPRVRSLSEDLYGAQRFVVENVEGRTVAQGTLLVVGRVPEAVDISNEDGTRIFELLRATPARIQIRTHGNVGSTFTVLNPRDVELTAIQPIQSEANGTLVLTGTLRALRQETTELRLGVETLDGRTETIVFPGMVVRPPAPRRVRVLGGPIAVDATGRASARLVIHDLPLWVGPTAELLSDQSGELIVVDQRYDSVSQTLLAQLDVYGRSVRQPGSRELREITVRAGAQVFRGSVELVGPPLVSAARTEPAGRAAVTIDAGPTLLRITGQNLEGLRLDCSTLGPGASCRPLGASATEIVTEITLTAPVREGEQWLPLVATSGRGLDPASQQQATVRLTTEYPAVPMPLTAASFLRFECPAIQRCRRGSDGESILMSPEGAMQLVLGVDEGAIPAAHGWQKVIVTVTRVRGEQRTVVRTFGTPTSPRLIRQGLGGAALTMLDASADPRHGDQFIVRVEHAGEQYAAEHRAGAATAEAFVRRVYVDGGTSKRITGDIAVQPVLAAFARGEVSPWYPNAGFGVTWQPLNDRLEPRVHSIKLQLLATNIQPTQKDGRDPGQPAAYLSGNLRIPGTDPNRPLTITSGIARTFGGERKWHILAGAGIDLGVAKLIFGM